MADARGGGDDDNETNIRRSATCTGTVDCRNTDGEESVMSDDEQRLSQMARDYWRANIRLLIVLLILWFTVSFGFGIILAPWLNQIQLGGVPLGFWFAQQGSIYGFIAIIFTYVFRMNALDRKFGVEED